MAIYTRPARRKSLHANNLRQHINICLYDNATGVRPYGQIFFGFSWISLDYWGLITDNNNIRDRNESHDRRLR